MVSTHLYGIKFLSFGFGNNNKCIIQTKGSVEILSLFLVYRVVQIQSPLQKKHINPRIVQSSTHKLLWSATVFLWASATRWIGWLLQKYLLRIWDPRSLFFVMQWTMPWITDWPTCSIHTPSHTYLPYHIPVPWLLWNRLLSLHLILSSKLVILNLHLHLKHNLLFLVESCS